MTLQRWPALPSCVRTEGETRSKGIATGLGRPRLDGRWPLSKKVRPERKGIATDATWRTLWSVSESEGETCSKGIATGSRPCGPIARSSTERETRSKGIATQLSHHSCLCELLDGTRDPLKRDCDRTDHGVRPLGHGHDHGRLHPGMTRTKGDCDFVLTWLRSTPMSSEGETRSKGIATPGPGRPPSARGLRSVVGGYQHASGGWDARRDPLKGDCDASFSSRMFGPSMDGKRDPLRGDCDPAAFCSFITWMYDGRRDPLKGDCDFTFSACKAITSTDGRRDPLKGDCDTTQPRSKGIATSLPGGSTDRQQQQFEGMTRLKGDCDDCASASVKSARSFGGLTRLKGDCDGQCPRAA